MIRNSWISACWCCSQSILIQIVKNDVSTRVANAWFYIDFDYNLNCWLHAEGGDFVPIMAAGLFCCIGGLLTMDISCQLSSLVITLVVHFHCVLSGSPLDPAWKVDWAMKQFGGRIITCFFYMDSWHIACLQIWLPIVNMCLEYLLTNIYICGDNVLF